MFRNLTLCNFGAGGLLPYTLNFATSGFEAAWTAPNWTVSSGTAKNTPTPGEEDVTNGNMETGNPPSNWGAINAATLSAVADERTGGAGAQSLSVVNGIASAGGGKQVLDSTDGAWVRVSAWSRRVSGSNARIMLYTSGFGVIRQDIISSTSWTNTLYTTRLSGAGCQIAGQNQNNVIGNESRYDDFSVKPLSGILAYRNFGAANVRVKAPWTITANYQAGVMARVSADGTQYLLAYHDRTTCFLVKVLTAGTTQLIGITTAYVAGANVEIRCSGNTVQLFYNNSQVGTDQTESTLSANTRHGLFSTDVSCTVPSINVVAN